MKKMKKIFAVLIAMVMMLGMSTGVFAAAGTPGTGTITITPPTNATGENTYKIYKVFDATVNTNGAVAYKLLPGLADTDVPTGFTAVRGYITKAPASLDETASALAAYDKKILVDTVTTTDTTPGTSISLDPGYYYIETSTGTAVYVNAGGNIQIQDKNVIPPVVKSAGSEYDADSLEAIAAVGTNQPYTAVITKTHGATNLVFTDTMTGQTYNGDVTVTVGGTSVAAGDSTYTVAGAMGDSSFTVTFNNAYIAGLDDDTEITLNYSGLITSDALSVNPATNKAELTSGTNNKTESETVMVYNATVTVNKVDGDGAPLAGAKFKLKNNADDLYYAGSGTDGAANWTADGIEVEAVAVTDAAGNIISYTAEFKGLKDGTYTLEESTVPAGYNKAADQTITITAGDVTTGNLSQTVEIINMKGSELPATGGIGETIFYVIGAILILGAGVILVTRRRAAK